MQQQQQPGSQYGSQSPTDLTPFPSRPQFSAIHPDAPSPISSRPPPVQNFGELATTAAGAFHEDDVLAAGEDAERGGTPGNRWPREETLALLKIRSEMDAAFKDASLKGPLWENVSRKLGELGYIRSAKKCKEKFENVHKYYKRTKEGRAGRQDGKSYRFFTQLEALHTPSGGIAITGSGSGSSTPTTAMPNPIPVPIPIPTPPAATVAPTWASIQPSPPPSISAPPPPPIAPATAPAPSTMPQPQQQQQQHVTGVTGGISFSSDTFSSSSYESDDEDTEEGEGRKRKRGSGGPGGSRKMMAFFEGLMMQVMQKQEAMQQRFLETIEKREQDRTAREEAWKRQELARLNREHEILAQERAVAASRDAALISFLQKIGGGQMVQVPPPAPSPRPPSVQPAPPPPRPAVVHIAPPPPQPPAAPPAPAPAQAQPPEQMVQREAPQPIQHQHITPAPPPPPPQVQQHQTPPKIDEIVIPQNQPSSSCTELVPVPEQHEIVTTPRGAFELGVSPSRWPKSEVHALIKLRSGLEGRYQEAGPKGPLWEEISAGMQRLGYNRSSKRCKEKWENINKYFKKVKESNKKRPEDAKTCPYFHQLDALYRKKNLGSTSNPGYSIENNPQAPPPSSQPLPPPQSQPLQVPQPIQIQPETERKSETEKNAGNPVGGIQIQTSNGGLPSSFFEGGAAAMNKPEDIMKELMEQQHRRQAAMNNYNKMEQPQTDHNMYQDDEDDDDEDDEDDEDADMVYKMQFERQNVGNGGGGGGNGSAKPTATTTAGSFLGMVQ